MTQRKRNIMKTRAAVTLLFLNRHSLLVKQLGLYPRNMWGEREKEQQQLYYSKYRFSWYMLRYTGLDTNTDM